MATARLKLLGYWHRKIRILNVGGTYVKEMEFLRNVTEYTWLHKIKNYNIVRLGLELSHKCLFTK
jgi:hypothetical protein